MKGVNSAKLLQYFGIAGFFALGCALQAGATYWPDRLLANDPTLGQKEPQADAQRHTVELRFIYHDVTISQDLRDRLIRTTELIFSQCDSVDFHVKVSSEVKTGDSGFESEQTGSLNGRFTLKENFPRFFLPWRESRKPGVIDVHFVKEVKGVGTLYGKAYSESKVDALYVVDYPTPITNLKPSEIVGDSIVISMKAIEQDEKRITYGRRKGSSIREKDFDRAWTTLQSTLLAHELGHILMEDMRTLDHGCLGEPHNQCPRTNLMSAGGSDFAVYFKAPQFKEVLGYTPLPDVNTYQCDLLRKSPQIRTTR
jgi:hypothetical protein